MKCRNQVCENKATHYNQQLCGRHYKELRGIKPTTLTEWEWIKEYLGR